MKEQQIRKALAAAFSSYRSKHGLTQKQLAKLIGTNRSVVANIEAHRLTPGVPLAIEIYRVIGISIYELDKSCACAAHSHLS
jgi:DNA-binding XRE family transcriptional regulator